MRENFAESLRQVLKHEGRWSDHPEDPGGATNYGITIADYRRYIKPRGTKEDLRKITMAEVRQIYRQRYWEAMRCDELPSGVDFAVFDYGVNSGIGRAPKVLQRGLGVPVDGRIGPKTIAAAHLKPPAYLIDAICDERMQFLRRLRTWPTFGRGWARRVVGVRQVAKRMIVKEGDA